MCKTGKNKNSLLQGLKIALLAQKAYFLSIYDLNVKVTYPK